ncbi:MAG: hypothetical protein KDD51_05315 [Bdellovibrionales bacterium]|nr:hypothetical protein [Bdellovibrionales bacterium]
MLGLALSASDRSFLKAVSIVAAVVYFAAAFFSVGYHHPDEHFQILEYVALKLGSADPDNMAWEYHRGMRSWLQPGVLYVLTRGLQRMGFNQPPQWAFVYRLVSGCFSWLAAYSVAGTSRFWFRREPFWRATVLALFFFWCLPYLAVRTSSEAWSTAFLLFGLSACIGAGDPAKRVRGFLMAGLFWGLAFEFRFQTAVAVAGAVAYYLGVQRNARVLFVFPGVVVAICFGVIVDRWGYGYWELSAWQYFYQNLMVGKIAEFGVSPWWAYAKILWVKAGPPLSLILVLGGAWAWVRFPFHLLTWMTLPFFLVHSAIGHKEARFLIPILIPVLLQIGLLADVRMKPLRRSGRIVCGMLLGLNGLLLVGSLVKPADVKSDFYSHVAQKLGQRVVIYYEGTHPYGPVSRHKFFWFEGLSFVRLEAAEQFIGKVGDKETAYLFWREDTLPDLFSRAGVECELEHATVPRWLYRFDFNRWLERTPRYNLFVCRKASLGAGLGGGSGKVRQKKL